jgi:SRSO17 transposase
VLCPDTAAAAGGQVCVGAGQRAARVNGWSIARRGGDRTPDRTQRLLNHASWDTSVATSVVRRFAASGLEAAARRRRRGGMVIGAIDETGQEKAGEATAGVKRQYLGCAGRVANGINTVHLSYVREGAGHALIGARQWVPREHLEDPVKSLVMGLPPDLRFRTKGQLAIDISTDAVAGGIRPDFYCGDEVYGNCTELREHFQAQGQAYVLRVPSNFTLTLAAGTKMTCAEAVQTLLKHPRRWEARSAGGGSKGERWYAWAWLATASAGHHLLIRRHLKTGELAFHYCYVPEDQPLTKTRLIRAAGLRWPVEEDFEIQQGLLRPRPVPGPALHRHRPPRRAGHGRAGHLRHHYRAAARPHRHPSAAPGQARPAATAGTRHDPADHPRDQAAARRPHHPAPAPAARHPLGRLDPPPPSPLTMVPQTRQTRPLRRDRPAQLVKCGCLTRNANRARRANRRRSGRPRR